MNNNENTLEFLPYIKFQSNYIGWDEILGNNVIWMSKNTEKLKHVLIANHLIFHRTFWPANNNIGLPFVTHFIAVLYNTLLSQLTPYQAHLFFYLFLFSHLSIST